MTKDDNYMNKEDKEKTSTNSRVDPVDSVIAQRLYRQRCLMGHSQRDLANYTGISVQQIQKYEKSTNRISGGRLYRFAQFLDISINYFFDNMEEELSKQNKKTSIFAEDQEEFVQNDVVSSITEKEVLTLIRFYNGIKDCTIRKRLIDLVRAVSTKSTNYI